MSTFPLAFDAPGWLAGLLLCPLLFLLWRRHAARLGAPGSERAVPYLRAAALALTCFALAGASWWGQDTGVDLHVLVDRSMSVGTRGAEEAERLLERISAALGPGDRLAVYHFAADTHLAQPLSPSLLPSRFDSEPDGRATDIEGALEAVLARLAPGRSSRILLVSDGLETEGSAGSALTDLRRRAVPVDTVPVGGAGGTELAVDHLALPAFAAPGRPYLVSAVVSSNAPALIEASLYRNGLHVATQEFLVEAGRNLISFDRLEEAQVQEGAIHYEVRIAAPGDGLVQNNVGYGFVRVEGTSRALLVTSDLGRSEGLRLALESEGISVTALDPRTTPLDIAALAAYDAVVLDNVPAYAFSRRQLENLARFVEDVGGGLLVIGGEQSFGLGGYQGTPLEAVLPVAMDAPHNLILPSLAMILVLDRSGSMAETQRGFSKLDLAKEAALGVLDLIEPRDLLGVIAFDSTAEWIVPVQPAANRLAFASSIASLSPQGGTNLAPAIEEALAAFTGIEAAVKHLIILSDGRSSGGAFEALTARLRELGVTVSTVGIGSDADQELLEKISIWGGGRYYFTEDIQTVPQIFAVETMVVSRPILINEPFEPRWDQAADFWSAAGSLPPLGGYVITTPKAAAAVHLRAPDDSPLLATWRRGLGRAAAFSSSLTGPWSAAWRSWEGYAPFSGALLRWLMGPEPARGLSAQLVLEGGRGELVVDALDANGAYRNFLELEGEVLGPGGEVLRLQLEHVGPGRYRATFPAAREGVYTAVVWEEGSGGGARTTTGAVLPYPEEFRLAAPDLGLLRLLSEETGGFAFDSAEAAAVEALLEPLEPGRRLRSLTPLLLAAALALFTLDVGARYLPRAELGTTLASLAAEGAARFRSLVQRGAELEREIERRIEERQARERAERRARERLAAETPVLPRFKGASAERFLAKRRRGSGGKEGGRSRS